MSETGLDPGKLGAVLDTLCPMHILLDGSGHVVHAGPAMRKLSPDAAPEGMHLSDLLDLRRPRTSDSMEALLALAGRKLHFALRKPPQTELKGVLVPLPGPEEQGGAVLNLSFGISIVDAVRDFALTSADFAATDLAIEMLYLVEAKSAAMEELRRLNSRLDGARIEAVQAAFTDKLTGLRNRRALDPVMARLAETGTAFALMHLDLDYFKDVNDTYGHAAGDAVLQAVAGRLTGGTRDHDTLIRLGGDEFLLVLPGQTQASAVARLAGRLIRDIARPIPFGERSLTISASIGASLSQRYDPPDPARMMHDADTALYAAKAAGRSAYRLYSSELGQMGADAPQQG
ncbi:GGDEF domain-containing protein [Roseovarius indicus]|uniref:Cyclic di-GMP phosphodiesterase Gmr n=1 Tax=Roseovarius indicus TaxID=540747 RepID=A0A0T5P7R2_9RHOB|nr:GGDEF domain-containing protein [Roseovarius indicus]KRS17093.1 diguanylate cyclase [Roseovarius indicus]QEW27704.1 Cyclic di-GMP phosphodiesterase Gmr [Roseovarius indicus]SFE32729.1 diguanylate cyclase (GGDEF) domain-containing protein [Roseovarius indicus]